jgi:hypothetical protein
VPCPGRHRGSNECESSLRPTLNGSRFPCARLFVGLLIRPFRVIYAARTTKPHNTALAPADEATAFFRLLPLPRYQSNALCQLLDASTASAAKS